jgi:hypothetical protein
MKTYLEAIDIESLQPLFKASQKPEDPINLSSNEINYEKMK